MDITLIRDESSGIRSYGGDRRIPGPIVRYESSPVQLPRYKSFWAVNLRLRRNKGDRNYLWVVVVVHCR